MVHRRPSPPTTYPLLPDPTHHLTTPPSSPPCHPPRRWSRYIINYLYAVSYDDDDDEVRISERDDRPYAHTGRDKRRTKPKLPPHLRLRHTCRAPTPLSLPRILARPPTFRSRTLATSPLRSKRGIRTTPPSPTTTTTPTPHLPASAPADGPTTAPPSDTRTPKLTHASTHLLGMAS